MPTRLRRLLPIALCAACVAGFVVSGLHTGESGGRTPTPVSKPSSKTTYYINATVGGKTSERECLTEVDNSRVITVPCP